ncbi:DNA adenine methylase [Glaciecola sp. 1036]|uniref:DNA adenine methylase n=1 Tax=Alteromonadaceae TaxID=72275 RepID=UPI003CFCE2B3
MHLKLSPPLKWAGGKRWLVPKLQVIYQHFPHSRLVEPFVGGMSVALGLNPSSAVLNDANLHLINFYQQIQSGLAFDLVYSNNEDEFYSAREKFNQLIAKGEYNTAEAASLFYYLMRTGFNGLCRFNRSGFYNVPFGRYKTINYQTNFDHYQQRLSQWQFRCGDFAKITLEDNDFIYMDPPYDVEFTQYSQVDFKWDDQIRLLDWVAEVKNPVVISNQATKRIIKAYRSYGFKLYQIAAPRMIACNGDRKAAMEVFAVKNMPRKVIIYLNKHFEKL